MSGHTKGPWTVTDNNWEVSSVYGPDDCLIAEVQIHPSVTEHNQHELEMVKEANARLIGVSPELLSALAMVCSWKSAVQLLAPELGGLLTAIYHAETVIAKAEGRP